MSFCIYGVHGLASACASGFPKTLARRSPGLAVARYQSTCLASARSVRELPCIGGSGGIGGIGGYITEPMAHGILRQASPGPSIQQPSHKQIGEQCVKGDQKIMVETPALLKAPCRTPMVAGSEEWHDWHEHDWHAWQLDCAGFR